MASGVDIEQAKERARQAVDAIAGELTRISREIHTYPELAFEERRAAAQLVPFLETQGFAVERGAYGMETAFRGEWGHGPVTIALCAEYDALPEIGHACGHNLIATAGVGGAAALIKAIRPEDARIVILGTPAEEGTGGKCVMVEKGAFDDIDVAMMAHPMAVDIVDPPMLGVIHVDVEYRGKAVHASVGPEQGKNALDALVTAYQAIAQLRQHIRRDARIHGIITHGGAAPNIVPDYTAGKFYIRALHPKYLEELRQRVGRASRQGRSRRAVSWSSTGRSTRCTSRCGRTGRWRMRTGGTREAIGPSVRRPSEYLDGEHGHGEREPGGAIDPPDVRRGEMIFNDMPEFTAAAITDAAHASMLETAQALAMTGVDLALDPELVRAAKDEFAGRR